MKCAQEFPQERREDPAVWHVSGSTAEFLRCDFLFLRKIEGNAQEKEKKFSANTVGRGATVLSCFFEVMREEKRKRPTTNTAGAHFRSTS